MSEKAEFYFGDACEVLGGADFAKLFPVIVSEGKIAVEIRTAGSDPAAPRAACLIAWPDETSGMMAFILSGEQGGNNEFLAAWPFTTGGIGHELKIEEIHGDEDSPLMQLFECTCGGVPVTVFDSFWVGARRGIGPGDRISARLHGWAVMLEGAPTKPIVLLPENVSESMRESFREVFERDGKVTIETHAMAALLPYRNAPSPLHEIQGVVKAIRPGEPVLGLTVWTLTVTVGHPYDGDDDLDIEISVTSETWQGVEPKVGEAVRGLIWLQGAID